MWSMPKSVLRVVAVIIAACALGGFVLGVRGAPEKARLPGESTTGPGQALVAPDATILNNDERPAPPPPKTEAELLAEAEKKAADEKAKAELAKLDRSTVETAPPMKIPPVSKAPVPPTDDQVGDLIDGLTPPPEQPPY